MKTATLLPLIAVLLSSCSILQTGSRQGPQVSALLLGHEEEHQFKGAGKVARFLGEDAGGPGLESVRLLHGVGATTEEFHDRFRWLISDLVRDKKKGLFLFIQAPGYGTDDELFLDLPGVPEDPSHEGLSLTVLAHQLQLIKDNHAVIILDTRFEMLSGVPVHTLLDELPIVQERHKWWITDDPRTRYKQPDPNHFADLLVSALSGQLPVGSSSRYATWDDVVQAVDTAAHLEFVPIHEPWSNPSPLAGPPCMLEPLNAARLQGQP